MFDDFDSREPPFLTEAERFLAYIFGVINDISHEDSDRLCRKHPQFFCVRISLLAFISKLNKSKNKDFFIQDFNNELDEIQRFIVDYRDGLENDFRINNTIKKYKM